MTTEGGDDGSEIVEPPVRARLSLATSHGQPVSGDRYVPEVDRPGGTRKNIWIRMDTNLDLMVTSTCRALAHHPNVYLRSGRLVEVVGQRIVELEIPTLRERIAETANFFSYTKEKGKILKPATESIVQSVRARKNWIDPHGLREIVGVTDAPMLRADGSILDVPGYDPATRYVYVPSTDFGALPTHPTRDDARNALAELVAPLGGYPWKRVNGLAPSLSAYVSLLLTVFARHLLPGVPAFAISATTPGTGKTYLARIVSILLTGQDADVERLSKDDEEIHKSISGSLRDGNRLLLFDNVVGSIDSATLCILLTGPRFKARVLGRSEQAYYQNDATLIFTGNNIRPEGDLCRRWIPIELAPSEMSPETRVHGFDPIELAMADRARFVRAILTILRAWIVADRPKIATSTLGSYPAWSAFVPQVLVWLGLSNPLDVRVSDAVQDTKREALCALANAWEAGQTLANAPALTVQHALRLAYPEVPRGSALPASSQAFTDMLEGALDAQGKIAVSKALIYALRSARDRVLDERGRRLTGALDRDKIMHWRVTTPN